MKPISRPLVFALSVWCFAIALLTACKSKSERTRDPVPVASPERTADAAPPPVVAASRVEDVTAVIEELLRTISASKLTFIRNGAKHTGQEAAAHIRSKYEHVRDDVKTPEAFIGQAASRSIVSGKPYLVELENGTRQPLADWLVERLATLRQRH